MTHNKKCPDNWERGVLSKNKTTIKNMLLFCSLLALIGFTQANAGINTGLEKQFQKAGPFPVGFEFQLYDQKFKEFYVRSHGLIQFKDFSQSGIHHDCTKGRNNQLQYSLMVFMDYIVSKPSNGDLKPGAVLYEMVGESPNRQLIVQWHDQYIYMPAKDKYAGIFQAILYEGTNEIKYQYYDIGDYLMFDRPRNPQFPTTIGLQGRQGQAALYAECNLPEWNIKPGQAILFTPNANYSDYTVDKNADYNFIDISGLIKTDLMITSDRFLNSAPVWDWEKKSSFNNYEIEIQDTKGNIMHTQRLGDVNTFTYQDGKSHGNSFRARIRGSINNGGTWEAWSALSSLTTVDLNPPVYSIDSFYYTGNHQAQLKVAATDDLSGVAEFCIKFNDLSSATQCFPNTKSSVTLNNVPEAPGTYGLLQVSDKAGNSTDWDKIELVTAAPVLSSPIANQVVSNDQVQVVGKSVLPGKVQLYLNQQKVGSLITTDTEGNFVSTLQLPKEGRHTITADVSTEYGTSVQSVDTFVTLVLPMPIAEFVTPSQGVILDGKTNKIEVSVNDVETVKKVELILDKTTILTTLTTAPYEYLWSVDMTNNGVHNLTAKVTNEYGKTLTIARDIVVDIQPPPPEPAPYVGEVTSITPAVSYGPQAIEIKGKGIINQGGDIVRNSPLNLILKVDNFERTIEVVTDSQGNFNYQFIPQESDAGIYTVSVSHPNQKEFTEQGTFTIDRIAFDYQGFNLKAVRNVETSFTVHTTTSAGAEELRWVMRAEDQPSGQLPQGISIDNGTGIKVLPNQKTPMVIKFKGTDQAVQRGTVHLVALAKNSGDRVRGQLQLNYDLAAATPALVAKPTSITTGLSQNQTITEQFTIANKGTTAAKNVKVDLVKPNGQPADSWIFVSNNSKAGIVEAGSDIAVQITVSPNEQISNGIYQFIAKVSSDNGVGGDVPVSVSITQSGQGTVQFDVADIYTATLDAQGQKIPGVKNAVIKLQNEAVLTEQYTITSDDQGIASLADIPTGIYRYRASAYDHMDVSGRIMIRPGVTINEHIFLEYQLINIEFDVTEKTIKDEYDIEIEATFKTDVPAPVVLIEPLSINLAGLKEGDVKTGQITLSNYGLVQADNVAFTPPQSNAQYHYEFFGEVPSVLMPKSQVVIPYKVTVLKAENNILKKAAPVYALKSDSNCSSYYGGYDVNYQSECANGDISKGNSKGNFYRLSGSSCNASSGGGWNGGWTSGGWGSGGFGGNGGGWTSGGGSSVSPMPMSLGCVPVCTGECSITGGTGAGND